MLAIILNSISDDKVKETLVNQRDMFGITPVYLSLQRCGWRTMSRQIVGAIGGIACPILLLLLMRLLLQFRTQPHLGCCLAAATAAASAIFMHLCTNSATP
jgi:hypothetical protein